MSAELDCRLLEVPLSELTAAELPMAIMLRRRVGGLDEAEVNHATIVSLANAVSDAIESRSYRDLVAFINAMAETLPPDRRIQERAVEVGTAPDLDDASNTMVIVLGASGSPVADRNGRLMIFSLNEINRLAVLSWATRETHTRTH